MTKISEAWPAWAEFGTPPSVSQDSWFSRAKAEVIAEYGEEALRQGWLSVCKDLETITDKLVTLGSASIPVLHMDNIRTDGLSDAQRSQIKDSGCAIVRGVIPEKETENLFNDLKNYVKENRDNIQGWPETSPSIFRLYNSPTQIAVRTHPNQIRLQRILNSLYHDESGETSPEPLSYTDATRIRPPGQTFLGLGPHIDAGSLCRWADPTYRKTYKHIFSGTPELHDEYDLGARRNAEQFMFEAKAHSVVFRSFQGWTALTPASPSCGTLMLYPHVPRVIAYVLLRPFFDAPADEADIMDASKWTFNRDSDWFPGTMIDQSQRLSPSSHPHLRLKDCVMHIPPMYPGDTVWWHTDMCHAVDPEHQGTEDASVVYVAACPTTNRNKTFVKQQLEAALAGQAPPDCVGVEINETMFKGYTGYDRISTEGRSVLGFDLIAQA